MVVSAKQLVESAQQRLSESPWLSAVSGVRPWALGKETSRWWCTQVVERKDAAEDGQTGARL